MANILGMDEDEVKQIAVKELPKVCLFCVQFTFMGNPDDGRCHWGAKPGLMVGKKMPATTDASRCSQFEWHRGWLANMAVRAQGGWIKFHEEYDRSRKGGHRDADKV